MPYMIHGEYLHKFSQATDRQKTDRYLLDSDF